MGAVLAAVGEVDAAGQSDRGALVREGIAAVDQAGRGTPEGEALGVFLGLDALQRHRLIFAPGARRACSSRF